MKRVITAALVVLLHVFACPSAFASEEHYEKGTVFYNLQDWANALKEYRLSYEIEPKPGTLWAIAQTQRLSGDCRAAILTYRAYARVAAPAGVAAAEELTSRCQAQLEEQRRTAEQAARARHDKPTPPAPPDAPVKLASSARNVEIERAWYADPLGDVLLATGLAGVGVGAFYLRSGNRDMRDAAHAANYRTYERGRSDAQQKERIGVAALSAGLAVTALSVVRFALCGRHSRARREPRVQVLPIALGAQLHYRAAF